MSLISLSYVSVNKYQNGENMWSEWFWFTETRQLKTGKRPGHVFLISNAFGEPVPTVVTDFCSWLTMWPSAVVAHPGSACCMYIMRWFLLTMVVKDGYMSYCKLPVSLNQSSHSTLIFLINKAFPQNCCSIDVFCLFACLLVYLFVCFYTILCKL